MHVLSSSDLMLRLSQINLKACPRELTGPHVLTWIYNTIERFRYHSLHQIAKCRKNLVCKRKRLCPAYSHDYQEKCSVDVDFAKNYAFILIVLQAIRFEQQTHLENWLWVKTSPSSLMGNFTSTLPTIFWILKSKNFAGKPSFCTTLAYFLAASLDSSTLLAPVQTILPELKMSAVVRGTRMRMITAANLWNCQSSLPTSAIRTSSWLHCAIGPAVLQSNYAVVSR